MFEIYRYIEFGFLIILAFFGIFMIIGMIRYFYGSSKAGFIPKVEKEKAFFAIIIPARDESKVIQANLMSIMESDYPKDKLEIYLIVESKEDPTVEIAKKFPNVHIFYRIHLENVGKGYALDECLKYIYTNKDIYDAFIILDADNVLDKEFISGMNDAYQSGYDMGCGKRENKDWNASVTCGASALTFTIINSIQNKPKMYYDMNVLISGTGFFFKSSILKEYCGWPFHTLTEDYELTNYSIIHQLKSAYVENAIYYDEQPLKMWQSIVQRTRWIQGYFSVRRQYSKEKLKALKENRKKRSFWYQIIGGIPMICMAVTLLLYIFTSVGFGIVDLCLPEENYSMEYVVRILGLIGSIYLVFVLFTGYLFYIDRKTIRIRKWQRIKVILFHPIFMVTYVISAIRAIFVKPKWEKIEHTINVKN